MKSLVGYTGFVGSNIALNTKFDGLYNSKNISDSFGTSPELLVYSGLRAEKYLANKEPEKDLLLIDEAIENIKKINPKKIVLVSTIDVYKQPINVDEYSEIDTNNLHPYGLNRYFLEKFVEETFENHLIVRLPGLYGKNLKKNFIFDMINIIPSMLSGEKFKELNHSDNSVEKYYTKQDSGFYKCGELCDSDKQKLTAVFETLGFSSLNFTDSRATYQFFNLSFLWEFIQTALSHNIKKLNIATQPINAGELLQHVMGKEFCNHITNSPAMYDFRTKYAEVFGGKDGYIFDRSFVNNNIKTFIAEHRGE